MKKEEKEEGKEKKRMKERKTPSGQHSDGQDESGS